MDKALAKYTAAREALQAFQDANPLVFNQNKKLLFDLLDAENALRDETALAKTGISNEKFEVAYTPQTQTFADIEVIDNLINGGIIQANRRSEIVKTVERPAHIRISDRKVPSSI